MPEPSSTAADLAALVREAGAQPERRLSAMANGLLGSDILRIAGEVRALKLAGQRICDLTVGDFSPSHFPIPVRLMSEIHEALTRGETNYPPATGLPELRKAVADLYARELGLPYPVDSVIVTSGTRPGIYATYRTLCDPQDRVVYTVPSWNNNHYTYLVGAAGVPLVCGPEDRFLPSREAVRAELPGARLLCLCSPLNPAGTVISRETLSGICEDVVAENRARETRGARPLYLLYDHVYWTLTFGDARHFTPPALVPEMARFTFFVDGISKAFSATGLRVGWVVGPTDAIAKLASLIGHMGAWAPRPEQAATVALLRDVEGVREFQRSYHPKARARLATLRAAFEAMRSEGLPVDSLEPAGAIYLAARIAPFGKRTPDGRVIETNEQIRRYVLESAQLAIVPFQAFGTHADDGWFRLSVGAVGEAELEAALPRLAAAVRALR
jgi:aspartate aminotransferase